MISKKELKMLDCAALDVEIVSLRKELFNVGLNKVTGSIKDTSQFKKIRASIAAALTLKSQKQAVIDGLSGKMKRSA